MDLQVIISVINAVDKEDPEIQAKIPKVIKELSEQFQGYPKDKREMLKEGIWLYIEWGNSLANDLQKYLVDSFKNSKPKTFEQSQQTLNLYIKASKHNKVKEMMDIGGQATVKMTETWKREDPKLLPQEKIKEMSDLFKLLQKSTSSKIRTVYEGVFNEKYPESS
jgi:hypothetical protein